MKVILLIIFSCIVSTGFSQTQGELNQQAFDSLTKANEELTIVYQKILNEYKKDTVFIKNLIKAQEIWVKFRDAEVEMKFPEREPFWYGSMHPMCVAFYQAVLTNERIKTLREWLIGAEEGEGCAGSIKWK